MYLSYVCMIYVMYIYIYMYVVNIQLWNLHLPQVPWFDPTSARRHLAQAGHLGEGAEGLSCLVPL